MEDLFIVALALAVLVLAVLVIAVLVLWMKQRTANSASEKYDELLRRLNNFETRLTNLERTPRPAPAAAPVPPPAPTPTPAQTLAPPPPQVPYTVPTPAPKPLAPRDPAFPGFTRPIPPPAQPVPQAQPQPTPQPQPARSVSLEERLGQNWHNKLGIVILVIGLALFLGYKLRTLGPLGKSAIGLAVDIWQASPSDRYLTLIVLGAALLLVSFLYSRYRETILKFL